MTKLSNWLHKISSGRVALIALIIFVAFTATVLPAQAQKAAQTANGADSPDGSFFYTANDLYESAETFGEVGRKAYIRARWSFDVLWPLVYTLFLATSISWVFSKAFSKQSKLLLANLVPVLGMAFDFLENSAATVVMSRYPEAAPIAANLAPIFTPIKWLFVYSSFVVLLVGFIFLLVIQRKKKKA